LWNVLKYHSPSCRKERHTNSESVYLNHIMHTVLYRLEVINTMDTGDSIPIYMYDIPQHQILIRFSIMMKVLIRFSTLFLKLECISHMHQTCHVRMVNAYAY